MLCTLCQLLCSVLGFCFFFSSLSSHPICPQSLSFLVISESFSWAALWFTLWRAIFSPPCRLSTRGQGACVCSSGNAVLWVGRTGFLAVPERRSSSAGNKIPLSVQLPVSSTESCAAQTWGIMPGAHEIIGHTGCILPMLFETLGENCFEFFFLRKTLATYGQRILQKAT